MQHNLVQLLANRLHWNRPSVEPDDGIDDTSHLVQKGIFEKHRKELVHCDCGECDEPSEVHYEKGEIFYYCLTYVQKVHLSEREATLYRLNKQRFAAFIGEVCQCASCQEHDGIWAFGKCAQPMGRYSRSLFFTMTLRDKQELAWAKTVALSDKTALLIVGSPRLYAEIDPEDRKRIFLLTDVIKEDWQMDVSFINDRFAVAPKEKTATVTSRAKDAQTIEKYLGELKSQLVGIYRKSGYDEMMKLQRQITKKFISDQTGVEKTKCTRILQDKLPLGKWTFKSVGALWLFVLDPTAITTYAHRKDY